MKARFALQRGVLAATLLFASGVAAVAAHTTRFWNLTANTITVLQLAPAGTATFGPDQCKNDKDGSVEHDERLKVSGVSSGSYDIKFTDAKGRSCTVKNVAVKEGDVFSLDEKQLGGGACQP